MQTILAVATVWNTGLPAALADEQPLRVEAVDPAENSPKEKARLQLFADPKQRGCVPVRTTSKDAGSAVDKDLDVFVREIVAAVNTRDDKRLQPLFHRRTNTGLYAIGETFARMANVVGLPLDVSVYKLWALNTVDGSPKAVNCEDEGVTVYPLYGYPLQFGLWLQVLGKTELGRIFISIVPADGKWNIGSYHFHQWTHAGKDPGSWVREAFQAKADGDIVGSHMRFDLAKKLLNAGKFLEIPAAADAESARDAVLTSGKFEETVRMGAKTDDIPFVATLLVVDGIGIFYRIRVPGEISTEDIKKRCRVQAEAVKKATWAKGVTGIRCSFLMPKEAPEKEGALGGIYIALSEVK
jgi:hypothetical protein